MSDLFPAENTILSIVKAKAEIHDSDSKRVQRVKLDLQELLTSMENVPFKFVLAEHLYQFNNLCQKIRKFETEDFIKTLSEPLKDL
jgi:predicted GTPase